MKIGIFGGTFNPIHKGHLALINRMIERLALDRLILMPAAVPPHKDAGEVIPAADRVAMCRLAVAGDARVHVSTLEIERGGKSYTVDTLRDLKGVYPDDELILLVGSDMFYTLTEWHCAAELLRMVRIAAMARESDELSRLFEQRDRLNAMGARTDVIVAEPVVISSTEIREHPEHEGLPEAVEQYIEQNGLYGRPRRIPVDLDELTGRLRATLSRGRYTHTINVASAALRLAKLHDGDGELAYLAGLLHDVCKEFSEEEMLNLLADSDIIKDPVFLACGRIWHGFAAAIYIQRELSILNTQIIEAVRYHTTGRGGMSLLEEIVYLADLTSADRRYPGVEALRATAERSIPEAMLESLQFILGDLAKNGRPVTCDTLKAYNRYALLTKEAPRQV